MTHNDERPPPDEIRRRSKEIRDGWTPAQRDRRRVTALQPYVDLQVIIVSFGVELPTPEEYR